jgi:dTDP-glucose 4,6-dehydratase
MTTPVRPLPREDLEHILAHTEDLWAELRGSRIFITGGTGFFGMWLLESFCHANDRLSLGAKATVLTRDPDAFASKAPHLAASQELSVIAGDVRDFEFPEGIFSHVIHAATTSSAPVEPLEMFDTILRGTRRVLEFAAGHGTRKLLFTSSGAVYGRQPPNITHVPEDYCGAPDPTDPASAYGEGKRAAELLCALMASRHGFEAKIARCFAFVGPHLPLDAHFAIGNFIRDALGGGPIRVNGDGTPLRSYLYAADLAIWLWTILLKGAPARPYNVGSDEAISIADLAHAIGEMHGVGVSILGRPTPGAIPARYVPSAQRARSELGLAASIDTNDGVRRTVRWLGGATSAKMK